jgi:hypothetical protein
MTLSAKGDFYEEQKVRRLVFAVWLIGSPKCQGV